MAQLHLSRKQTKSQQNQALLASAAAVNSNFLSGTGLPRPNSIINQAMGIATSVPLDTDSGNLEMLLESYFKQLDEIRNRIVMVCSFLTPKPVVHLHSRYPPWAFLETKNMPPILSYFENLCLFTIISSSSKSLFLLFIMEH